MDHGNLNAPEEVIQLQTLTTDLELYVKQKQHYFIIDFIITKSNIGGRKHLVSVYESVSISCSR